MNKKLEDISKSLKENQEKKPKHITETIQDLKTEIEKNKENTSLGWRDSSVVKSTACSSKGPEFNSQQPHGVSQPSVMTSGALFLPADIQTEYCIHNKY